MSLDTGLSFTASLDDLEELGGKLNDLFRQARDHQNSVRASTVDLHQYGLVFYPKQDVWTLPNALGKFPYGVPLLKYNGSSNFFGRNKMHNKKELDDRWHFTLSTQRNRNLASAKYDDIAGIEQLVSLLRSADPETMAIQFALQDKTNGFQNWDSVEITSTGNERSVAKTLLESSLTMPPVPDDLFQKLENKGLKPSLVNIIEPELYRLVMMKGWIYVSSETRTNLQEIDRSLKECGYMGLPCNKKARDMFYHERYAVPLGYKKKVGTLNPEALTLLTSASEENSDIFSFMFAEARGAIDFTPLTYEERNSLLENSTAS